MIGQGLPASPGAASGEIVFDSDEAERLKAAGQRVILVRIETSPEDIHGMHAAEGILTTRGGMTSHAAVVARGMGKPCVSGAGGIRVDYAARHLHAAGVVLKKGEIDHHRRLDRPGDEGRRSRPSSRSSPAISPPSWNGPTASRRMKVRANAETPLDARAARDFGAEGIGLCRTEHMFFDAERIVAVREMILAETWRPAARRSAKILPMQRQDFIELFEIMAGLPVTIRLLDPPLHEFLPQTDARDRGGGRRTQCRSPRPCAPASPNCRSSTRCSAIAACGLPSPIPKSPRCRPAPFSRRPTEVARRTGKPPIPEIMVPLVAGKREFDIVRDRIVAVAEAGRQARRGRKIDYLVGTMIELPRAALRAGEIAEIGRVLLLRHQ